MPGSSRSAASGRDGSIGCHSRHGPVRSRSSCSASQQARVLPVEDPPTSTAIPLLPSAAARTTWPSSVSCSRGTYAGSTGSPGCGSSGCTGRCTSSANGSVTSSSGHPAAAEALPGLCSPATGELPRQDRQRVWAGHPQLLPPLAAAASPATAVIGTTVSADSPSGR